jgi:hypothetical protein
MQLVGNDFARLGLSEHLDKDLEVGDPKRPVGFKGRHNLGPRGLEPLCGCDVGGDRRPQRGLEILVPFPEREEESLGEERFFRGEVVADRGQADSCRGRDVPSRGSIEPLFQQALCRSGEQRVAIVQICFCGHKTNVPDICIVHLSDTSVQFRN